VTEHSKGEKPEGREEDHAIIPIDEHRDASGSRDKAETPVDEEATEPETGELDHRELKAIVEALLFSAEAPLRPRRLAELSGARDARQVRKICEELSEEYGRQGRAFGVQEIGNGYQLLTHPDFHPWVSKLRRSQHEDSLSQAALETLSIVAYRQPITRAEIEDVRGVQSGYILRSLVEKGLVRVTGRSDELGRPLLYGTTDSFLQAFGLASLDALPELDELEPPEADAD
jgi:segregation and condensation protein B